MSKTPESFMRWYTQLAATYGLDQNPDNPLHFYDYRAAYQNEATPDSSGHWPSQFKRLGHPNLIVNGIDTRTGKRATQALIDANTTAAAFVKLKMLLGIMQ